MPRSRCAPIALALAVICAAPAAAMEPWSLLAQSRLTTCSFGANASYYAKLRVLAVDTAARRVHFEILVNTNCGYRGLEPGLPTR